MSRICRTCLQKSNTTFRTSQVLGDFGEGAVRISVVLRYCIPELYLGLSLNPEICLTCKENLKVAYLFKKRCISTENTIGNFLKSTRSTGQCVDLHDVLAFMNGKGQQIQLDILRQATDVTNVANKIPSKPAESTVVSTEASQVVGVNPVVAHPISQGSLISINNGTSFIIQPGMLSQIFGQSINNQTVGILQRIDNPNILPSTQNVDDPNNVCKISNISSMDSNQLIIKNDLNSTITNVIEHSIAHEELTIKDEPLDIEPNSAEPSVPLETDEETLDASETASYPETHVEGFLEDVPEGNFQDQYVDVPDFVTINNFGFKELEELRQQQQMEKEKLDENASLPNPDASNLNKEDNAVEELDISEKEVDNSVDAMAELPDVLYIDGKRMVKCANGYRQAASDDSTTVIQEENLLAHVIQVPEKSKPSSARKRNRRKIKIVAVGDQPEGKKFKSNTSIAPKPNDSDVVVLFTSYTMDCMYINDHDYLISPYRRNKILFEENCRWMCMCHICHSSHTVTDHVKHMSMHGSKCKLCLAELGTPYMHNIHLRVHKKACRYCTQVLPYAQLKSHEATHEREILEDAGYTGRKRKRKPNKDEKMNSYGKKLLAPALKNKETNQTAERDALKVALDNDVLVLPSDDLSDFTNLESTTSSDTELLLNSSTDNFSVETAIGSIPSNFVENKYLERILPEKSNSTALSVNSIRSSLDSDSDYSPDESNSETDEDVGDSFEKNQKRTRNQKDSSEISNATGAKEYREENNVKNESCQIGRKKSSYTPSIRKLVKKRILRDNPCKKRSCPNECNNFTEDERREIFKFYWNLTNINKQKFLSECITIGPVKIRRESKGIRTKKYSNKYYFQKNNERKRVCRQFFINTLDISVRVLRTVVDNKNGKYASLYKREEQLARFKAFIDSLLTIPSHNCGESSTKYLPSETGSFNNIYKLYLRVMENESSTPLKRSKFLALLKTNYNIGIHTLKKMANG